MKKRMGRPKIPKDEALSVHLTTRVTPVESKAIHDAIKASGQAKTEWLRNALLKAANVT